MIRKLTTLALAFAVITACEQKPKTEATPPAPPPAPVVRTMPANPSADQPLEAVPVSEDFEERATSEISSENLDFELTKLEKELE